MLLNMNDIYAVQERRSQLLREAKQARLARAFRHTQAARLPVAGRTTRWNKILSLFV